MSITFETIKNNKDINTYITYADRSLEAIGYTEHSFAHVGKVSNDAAYILESLGYPEREVELAKIAGYMHDIGNLVNRVDHSQSGAVMAFRILDKLGMDADEIATVVTAIGNHDEGTGIPVNSVAAALIIADKCDVRRSRVRNCEFGDSDIHDRVNYSAVASSLTVSADKKLVMLDLTIDLKISAVMDYFQIFLGRMMMSKQAAGYLGLDFSLVINGQAML
jgi:metal-dependent HD superfamily phosphatase/phosphodiesterase